MFYFNFCFRFSLFSSVIACCNNYYNNWIGIFLFANKDSFTSRLSCIRSMDGSAETWGGDDTHVAFAACYHMKYVRIFIWILTWFFNIVFLTYNYWFIIVLYSRLVIYTVSETDTGRKQIHTEFWTDSLEFYEGKFTWNSNKQTRMREDVDVAVGVHVGGNHYQGVRDILPLH